MRITKLFFQRVAAGIILLTCVACIAPTPQIDKHFGEAVSLINAQQVMHPGAGANTNPVAGIDGVAGKSAYDQYQKSFREPAPPSNSFAIGIGGK